MNKGIQRPAFAVNAFEASLEQGPGRQLAAVQGARRVGYAEIGGVSSGGCHDVDPVIGQGKSA